MKFVALVLLGVLATAGPALAQESDSPHRMVKPDGEPDADKCAVCHEPDLSLSRSKVETCTLCHATTTHSGTAEHLRTSAASVAARLPGAKEGVSTLPLTDDGTMFCGTCHLFHDPRLSEEKPLAAGWVPPSTGLAGAVRKALTAQWETIAGTHDASSVGAEFAVKSTRALRLSVDDGGLCRHCHGSVIQ